MADAPLATATIDDLDRYPWPDPGDPGYTAGLAAEARTLYEQTDYAVEASCGFYSLTDARVLFHTDGNVTPLLDDLVEIGVDVLNPVQPSALGDLAALKAAYGDRLSFSGAIDTHQVLPNGRPDDVRAEVKRRIQELGPGGGYILSSVHSILVDVPPENVLAMADAAQEFGRYPLEP